MAERIVIITGCSSGIGLSAAILLVSNTERKFKVYATMRNLAKKDELVEKGAYYLNKSLFVLQMDVCSDASVLAATKEVLDREGRIDALINNAGTGMMGALEHQSMEMITNLFETNVHGVIRTIRAVLPSMKKQKSGHIINISSVAGLRGTPFHAIYCSSKFAIEGLSESLAPELSQFNIKITLVEPGPVSTPFGATKKAKGYSGLENSDDTTKMLLNQVKDIFARVFDSELCQTADEVAEYILTALTAESPHFRYLTNKKSEGSMKKKYIDLNGDEMIANVTQRYFGNSQSTKDTSIL